MAASSPDITQRSSAPVSGLEAGAAVAGLVRHVELALAELDLSIAQYRLLIYLSVAPSIPSDLASRLEVRRPTITGLADGLVERGLVSREPDEEDRRRVRHLVTETGRHTLQRACELVDGRLQEVAHHLEPDDAEAAMRSLELWSTALGRHWKAQAS